MRYIPHRILVLMMFVLWASSQFGAFQAQTLYPMQNLTVSECEGTLTDSDDGLEDGQYNHNEDFTFSICVDDADEIRVVFDFFATEENLDVLNVYDGPDTNSPLLASLSGIINPPPLLVASSGCITFHFISDESIAANGWTADWEVTVNEPPLPELVLPEEPECPLSSLLFELDIPIPCDQFDVSSFSVVGPGGYSVQSVDVLDCDSLSRQASLFEVFFDREIDIPGAFRLFFEGEIFDACGEAHPYSTNLLFEVANCPISVEIVEMNRACPGQCGEVEARVRGNDQGDFIYVWSHTGQNAERVEICAEMTTEVYVEVTDQTSGATAVDTFTYEPYPQPSFVNPLAGDTVCSSRGDYFYNVNPSGGEFFSPVIPNWLRDAGRYQFWRWNNQSDLNRDIIEYVDPNGCRVQDTVWIQAVWAGSPQASCLGSSSFDLNGGNPPGGMWTGPHTTVDGVFDPIESGDFVVSYTASNGCVSSKTVRVSDTIIMPEIDTICRTQRVFLEAEPYGGRWSGPGIVNNVNGRLDGWRPTPGFTYTYSYDLEGCSAEMDIYIRDIQAGPDRTRCAGDSLLMVSGQGSWSGPAPYIDNIQAFDISQLSAGTYDFTLSAFGCSDRFELVLVDVRVEEDSPLEFCLVDDTIALDDYISFFPDNGTLTGPGIFSIDDSYYFNPILAGEGVHGVSWAALGCEDSIFLHVEPLAVIPDYSFCDRNTAVVLSADPSGGRWRGPGFLDPASGLFDPQSLNVGFHTVTYISPSGCETDTDIEIFEFEEAEILNIDQQYCFNDSLIEVTLRPPGGDFTINGAASSTQFRPSDLGSGNYELLYQRGSGACASSDRQFITILPPIEGEISVSRDSLCPDENAEIEISSAGGRGQRIANWNQGLGFGASHIVRPDTSTWYRVQVDDECSLPFVDSVFIFQHQPFSYDERTGPPVCFDDTTFAEILLDTNAYEIEWDTDVPFSGRLYEGQPGFYSVRIRELSSGCIQRDEIELPGSPPIRANMSRIPNQDCISNIENQLEIIDLSVGYTRGSIDFGDGTPPLSFRPGDPLLHSYADTGTFAIHFVVENELGCTDSTSSEICVENIARLYVPNVFSPNGDGKNDEFYFTAFGIRDVNWAVYNRYGDQLFVSRSENDSWNGTFRGKPLDLGVYVLRISYVDKGTGESGVYHGTITLVR